MHACSLEISVDARHFTLTGAKSISIGCNFSEVPENIFLFSKLGEHAERVKDKTWIYGRCS